ncbi:uncharacterized protein LOC131064539 isoform X2 [Cryptomeria japonica]|uniref:uncharacterized protein LOC131064539 isoform X2 n=1 Tax=Cryptomeria japonica TaxID=3369 RepID=UPI0025ABF2BF|nr:uncharacterized protein LOC131064539 isoform X2 [Cryptomeria japonica]
MESTVGEFIKSQVADWDDDVITSARFKAFSGQRSDWEARFQFWRDLIIKVARHLGRIIIDTEELEMYRSGDLYNRDQDVKGPTSSHFLWLFKQVASLIGISSTPVQDVVEGKFAVTVLVKERADQVRSSLTESHWTSHCVMTMERFQNLCGGFEEANVVMANFLDCRRAQHLLIDREDGHIEGVKVSLVSVPVTNVSQLDYDILHLHWTLDRLQKQLEVIDTRCKKSKASALSAIQAGNKQVSLRHVRYMKMALESKAKCVGFMDRVEEVLGVIVDTESTKKVSEAIQLGAQSIKENGISIEEVHACLQDLDESVALQREMEDSLGAKPISFVDMENEDLEEEFGRLEMELEDENLLSKLQASEDKIFVSEGKLNASEDKAIASDAAKQTKSQEAARAESLSQALSKLALEPA